MIEKRDLPPSELVRDMVSTQTPCGNTIFYPANLAIMGMGGTYTMFTTYSHESKTAYLCITQPDRIRFRAGGNIDDISEIYESAPWREVEMKDGNGTFFYKIAPSLQELEDFANNIHSK